MCLLGYVLGCLFVVSLSLVVVCACVACSSAFLFTYLLLVCSFVRALSFVLF